MLTFWLNNGLGAFMAIDDVVKVCRSDDGFHGAIFSVKRGRHAYCGLYGRKNFSCDYLKGIRVRYDSGKEGTRFICTHPYAEKKVEEL